MSAVLQEPVALQSALLMAGVHYLWNSGSIKPYQEAFLSNKISTIRAVNAALVDPLEWRKGSLLRLIATLALIEVRPLAWRRPRGCRAGATDLSYLDGAGLLLTADIIVLLEKPGSLRVPSGRTCVSLEYQDVEERRQRR